MALSSDDIQQIKDLIQGEMKRNFTVGVPKVPPHQHNKIDNLPVDSKDIVGGLVTKIIAGTGVTVSPTTGIGNVTVNSSGGGGSPGGSDTDVQYNSTGSFAGVGTFTFNPTGDVFGGPLLKVLDDVTAFSGTIITNEVMGDIADPFMEISDGNTSGFNTDSRVILDGFNRQMNIASGSSTGSGVIGTPLSIIAGDGFTTSGGSSENAGSVTISGGNITDTGAGAGVGGDITMTPGTRITVGAPGTKADVFIRKDIVLYQEGSTASSFRLGDGLGPAIVMQNVTTDPPGAAITGAGVLYVAGGALKYMGSSGTVTTIAVA